MMSLNEVMKTAVAVSSQCPVECRNTLLKVALSVNQPQNCSKILEKLSQEYGLEKKRLIEMIGLYVHVIRLFIETTDKEFNVKLIEMGFPQEFVEDLPLVGNRTKILATLTNSVSASFTKIKLASLKWRIDMSLSNSALVKKVPVSVILCLQLGNGKKYTINVSIQSFHKLRFTVALMMKEYANLRVNAIQ